MRAYVLVHRRPRDLHSHWGNVIRGNNGTSKELYDVGSGGSILIDQRGRVCGRLGLAQLRLEVLRQLWVPSSALNRHNPIEFTETGEACFLPD